MGTPHTHSQIAKSRLPDSNRIPERDRQFLDEYVDCYAANTEEVYLAYGDTIVLLKKVKVAYRKVSRTATPRNRPRGKFGGNRVERATRHTQAHADSDHSEIGRPEETSRLHIPAITDLTPSAEKREMFGLNNSDTGLIHLARKWVDDRKIKIDTAEDHVEIFGSNYKLQTLDYKGNFLNSYADYTYAVTSI